MCMNQVRVNQGTRGLTQSGGMIEEEGWQEPFV